MELDLIETIGIDHHVVLASFCSEPLVCTASAEAVCDLDCALLAAVADPGCCVCLCEGVVNDILVVGKLLELVVDCGAIPVVCSVNNACEEVALLGEADCGCVGGCIVLDVVLSGLEQEVVLTCGSESPLGLVCGLSADSVPCAVDVVQDLDCCTDCSIDCVAVCPVGVVGFSDVDCQCEILSDCIGLHLAFRCGCPVEDCSYNVHVVGDFDFLCIADSLEPHLVVVVRTRVGSDVDGVDTALGDVDVPSLRGLAETAVCIEPALSVDKDFTYDVSVCNCELCVVLQISDTVLACPCALDSDLELIAFIEDNVVDVEDVLVVGCQSVKLELCLCGLILVPLAVLEGSCTASDQAPRGVVHDECALVTCEEVCVFSNRCVEVEEDGLRGFCIPCHEGCAFFFRCPGCELCSCRNLLFLEKLCSVIPGDGNLFSACCAACENKCHSKDCNSNNAKLFHVITSKKLCAFQTDSPRSGKIRKFHVNSRFFICPQVKQFYRQPSVLRKQSVVCAGTARSQAGSSSLRQAGCT